MILVNFNSVVKVCENTYNSKVAEDVINGCARLPAAMVDFTKSAVNSELAKRIVDMSSQLGTRAMTAFLNNYHYIVITASIAFLLYLVLYCLKRKEKVIEESHESKTLVKSEDYVVSEVVDGDFSITRADNGCYIKDGENIVFVDQNGNSENVQISDEPSLQENPAIELNNSDSELSDYEELFYSSEEDDVVPYNPDTAPEFSDNSDYSELFPVYNNNVVPYNPEIGQNYIQS